MTTTYAPYLSLAGACRRKAGRAELVEILKCFHFFLMSMSGEIWIINVIFWIDLEITRLADSWCHTSLPKIRENGVATRVDDVYTQGEYPRYT